MEGLRGRRGSTLALAAAVIALAGCGSSNVAQHEQYRGLPGDRAPSVSAAGVLGATAAPASVAATAGLLLSTLPGGH